MGRLVLIPIHRCTPNTYVCVRSFHTEPATRVREKCKADNAKQTKHPSSASNRREAEESEEVATKSKTAKIAPEDKINGRRRRAAAKTIVM